MVKVQTARLSRKVEARLSREDSFTLEKAIKVCPAEDESEKQVKDLATDPRRSVIGVKGKPTNSFSIPSHKIKCWHKTKIRFFTCT